MHEDAATPRPAVPASGRAIEDSELLRRYAEERSETAFAELVRRRIGLVYAVALRQTRGDRHRAEDATQAVFTDLARKASSLANRPVLAGWLYRSAHYAAAGLIRAEQRRIAREQHAHLMETDSAPERTPADWDRVRPVLDEVLNDIDERDRDAVLLRFFDGRPFAEIGERFRLTENAARMRVERALDKLNAALARRGITSTAAALGVVLSQPIGAAAPAGLAATVTGVALTHVTTGLGAAGLLSSFMGMTKLQLGITTAAVFAGGAGLALQGQSNAELRREIAALRPAPHAIAELRSENRRLAEATVEVAALRQNNAGLADLERQIADARRAVAARAANNDATRLQHIRDADRIAQQEVDRMNHEGNALVKEYKALQARANDSSLSPTERDAARIAVKQKLAQIQAKQREVKSFIENARHVLKKELPAGDSPRVGSANYTVRGVSDPTGMPGKISLRSGPPPDARVSLQLPKADPQTALSAYELYVGKKIVRDPSVAHLQGTIDVQLEMATTAEAIQTLQTALRDQLNIVVEPGADGGLVARLGPPR